MCTIKTSEALVICWRKSDRGNPIISQLVDANATYYHMGHDVRKPVFGGL